MTKQQRHEEKIQFFLVPPHFLRIICRTTKLLALHFQLYIMNLFAKILSTSKVLSKSFFCHT